MALVSGVVLFVVAIWFAFGPDGLDIPQGRMLVINKAQISTAPRRKILTDPPTIFLNATDKTCMNCHRTMFKPDKPKTHGFLQHTDIRLQHGINTSCYNCHNKENRNLLVLRDGTPLPFNNVVQLCRQCHGSIYKAWTYGGHGRTNGYWDKRQGPQHRLKCPECHNPHSPRTPAMDPIHPLPGPDTLRMGEQNPEGHAEHDPIKDPLRRAMLRDQRAKHNDEQKNSDPTGTRDK